MRIKVVLLGLLGVVALAGASCSHDPDPAPVPTVSPTPTVTVTPAPPQMPDAARADSPAGAEAFARYWLVALNYAYRTGATSVLRSLGNCGTCQSLADGIDRLYDEGGRFEGGELTVLTAQINKWRPHGSASVLVYYSRASRKAIHASGGVDEVQAAARLGFLITLARVGDIWHTRLVQAVSGG